MGQDPPGSHLLGVERQGASGLRTPPSGSRLTPVASQLGTSATTARQTDTTFLSSSNPDQVKRNVLAGFKDALLLPVTIVPLTVSFGVNAIVTGSTRTVNGLSMLNPQRWGGQNATTKQVKTSPQIPQKSDGDGKPALTVDLEKAEDAATSTWSADGAFLALHVDDSASH